jgi:hypothetical protein
MICNIVLRSKFALSPDEIYQKPKSIKNFIYACLQIQIEAEEEENKK